MILSHHAPPPDAPSGVAAYAACLEQHLAAHVQFHPDAPARLYHIGNNPLHWSFYQAALGQPGAVLLHDACLHHLLLGQLSREAYIEEFVYNYGEWFREAADRYWRGRALSAAASQYFEKPLLRRLGESARLVIVHNPAAAAAVRAHCPQTRIAEIPHLFAGPPPASYWQTHTFRTRVGVADEEVLIGVLGHLRESKRIPTVLTAVARLRERGLPVRLLIQGAFTGPDLAAALAPQLGQPWVIRLPYLAEPEWWIMAQALDVAVNLRWPLAGEASGVATRLMGLGKAVLLTRSLENSRLPAAAAIQIDPGLPEQEQLEQHLAWLVLNPAARHSLGRHAALHIQNHHAAPAVAAEVARLLESAFDGHAATALT